LVNSATLTFKHGRECIHHYISLHITLSIMILGLVFAVPLHHSHSVFWSPDIDECALPTGGHICSYRCYNTPGSFHCTCPATGYTLAPNGRSCQGQEHTLIRITVSYTVTQHRNQ